MVGTTQLLVVIAGGSVAGLDARMGFRARLLADRVADVVWAAVDCMAFSVKTGGLAAKQAYVAAAGMAAAGASVQERPFDPVLRDDLARMLRLG
jgi:hypothetical protein